MKLTTILTTLLAAVGTATPTSSSAPELTSLFNADDAIKLYVQNTTLNALKQDMLKNKDTCAAVAATDSIDNSDKNSTVTTKADTTKADPPKTLEEILHYIWCQQCRDEFDKFMVMLDSTRGLFADLPVRCLAVEERLR
ncbi:hypothetical protein EKO04_000364 [Ascochyta lentis]|uniref:Uncharacterized protein n=1 Tax=Ascochyta lentis TaxID=205686 RepID=A0A8H7JCH5_9PLEO|nr:hypothetical protein EKO04_000364 [Ascochyta lentis]